MLVYPDQVGELLEYRTKLFLFLTTIVAALFAAPVVGQTIGEITGYISDASGAATPGAKIILTNTATNAVRTALSTQAGDYTFPAVATGFYKVRVEQASFKTGRSTVEVQVQQTLRLDFALEVGQVTESVQVSATAEMLQAENVSLGTVIDNKRVTELPLNGRN